MNKSCVAFITLILMLYGCQKNASHEASLPGLTAPSLISLIDSERKTSIDIEKSVVEWRGTKLLGTGKHEGTVEFSEGWLLISDGVIEAGYLEVDMQSVFVTDIPLSQPKAHRNLTNHLKSDFETKSFPKASFTITSAELVDKNSYRITGKMTIKGITKALTISASRSSEYFTSEFTFDRFDWKIGEDGSWLERRLVDADVHLQIKLYVAEEFSES